MKHGDLSNSGGMAVGIRCENTLFRMPKHPFILPFSRGNVFKHAKVCKEVLSFAEYVYFNTGMSLSLVIDNKNLTPGARKFFYEYPFCNLLGIDKVTEITSMLNTGKLSYYVVNDPVEQSVVSHKYAMDIQHINAEIRNRGI